MSHIIFNGKKILSNTPCISAFDRGLTLGHGFFETIMCINGALPLIDYHWKRLMASAKLLGITLPFNFHDLVEMINVLIKNNQLDRLNAALRLTLTDGIAERGLLSSGNQNPVFILTASEYSLIQKNQ